MCAAEPAPGQACRLSADGFKATLSLLALAKLPLSTRHNAVYDLTDVLAILTVMCEKSTFVKSVVAILRLNLHLYGGRRIPSARWFIGMFSRADPEVIERNARRMFSESVDMPCRQGVIPRAVTLAVDVRSIRTWESSSTC